MTTNIHLTPGDIPLTAHPVSVAPLNWFPNAAFERVTLGSAFTSSFLLISFGDTVIFDVYAKHVATFRATDFSGLGVQQEIETVDGCEYLTQIRDHGTLHALPFYDAKLSESEINKIFTELPATTRTATINISGNPGAATCDPSIATAKGYTVIN